MLFDLSDHAKFQMKGTDRCRFLNGQVTNDLSDPQPGHSIYACALTVKGKLSGDLWVIPQPDSLFLDWEKTLALAARLERYIIADDVEIADVTEQFDLFHWIGTRIPDTLQNITSVSQRFRKPGFDLLAPKTSRTQILEALDEPQSPETLDRYRIERGIPKWNAELTENVIPNEAGIESEAISYTKGCYVGQEIISRIRSVGHVNRQLCGLLLNTGTRFAPGDTLHLPETTEKSIGQITSACESLRTEQWIGLGYVRRGHDQPGTHLEIRRESTSIAQVTVSALPFFES
jgi:tRNA-modifying protein YgfZ